MEPQEQLALPKIAERGIGKTFLPSSQESGAGADFPDNFSRPKARIVVVENVYHQSPGRDPVGVDTSSSRFCDSDEQPFLRRTRIGDGWTPLETGWVVEPYLVCVRNDATAFRTNPTPGERTDAEKRVLELGAAPAGGSVQPFTAVRPGDSVRVYPVEGTRYFVRSRFGFTQVTINAFAG